VEIVTFRRDGRIPPDATRADYQARRWHYVALSWEAAPSLFEGMPEAELPASLGKPLDAPAAQQEAQEGRAEVS
jgi:hypothetical protein